MTAHAVPRLRPSRRSRGVLLPTAVLIVLLAVAGIFVSYVLWPTWPKIRGSLDAPAVPITVAGVLFNVPPAAIRAAVQRRPGVHERTDLVFLWPALTPPPDHGEIAVEASSTKETGALRRSSADDRVFVTIAVRGALLLPVERLRTLYPRYVEAEASAGPDGLAVLAFRAGTPYEGEDLVYVEEKPERFFALCTRAAGAVPGTCMHERSLDSAQITFRFPREWLQDWRRVFAGFDKLLASIHSQQR